MTKRIFRSILGTALAVLAVSFAIVLASLYNYFSAQQVRRLTEELGLAARGVEQGGMDYLTGLEGGEYRLTWVDGEGRVLFDTDSAAEEMENHGQREEIRQAMETGRGESARLSATLTRETVYRALRLADGTVLRVSGAQVTPLALVLWMFQGILLMVAAAVVLSAVLAGRMSRQIVEPLNHLDLEDPLSNETYEEIAPLLRRIHQQRRQIDTQMDQLRERADELSQITASMAEALVLLDGEGRVLSLNPAAQELFGRGQVGDDLLALDRSPALSHAVKTALEEGRAEFQEERRGRTYQMDVTRIRSGRQVIGTVLLAFDITDRALAEQRRREFTANVSHELKTPLQSILGSAELLENGMVAGEDMPRFLGRIHAQAARLLNLIEDIFRLSQLDEGAAMPWERVELRTLAQEVAAALSTAAAARGVTVEVTGEKAEVAGVRPLLQELLYNLCDNAVKYNVEGGSVTVEVSRREGRAVLSVRDTGIGIPEEYRDRVFERFFRVDKSRSKENGGTGLGLSIVKHAAQYHHARLELKSESGRGTEITVTFPAEEPGRGD